jgi:peptide/nickel transport system permease protein
MGLFLIKRAAVLVLSTIAATVVVFTFMAVLPGDPAEIALGVNATPEAVAALRAQFGTDRPLPVQYLDWAGGLFTGDFGVSYVSRTPITPLIADRLAVTCWLVLFGLIISLIIAVPLGTAAAVRHRRLSGLILSGVSQAGIAVPAFVAGIGLLVIFAVNLRVLPSGGFVVPAQDPVGFLRHLVLPALSLGLVQGAVVSRYIRSAVLDVLREDFLRTARAKGMGTYQALARHGARNAAIPVITVLGLQVATLLIGAVVIERVFTIPGLGSLLLDAVANRDLLLVQGTVMVLVVAVLVINFVVDVGYLVLDPRLRTS